jgi:hypothetical protein
VKSLKILSACHVKNYSLQTFEAIIQLLNEIDHFKRNIRWEGDELNVPCPQDETLDQQYNLL